MSPLLLLDDSFDQLFDLISKETFHQNVGVKQSFFYLVGGYFVVVVKTSNLNVDLNNLKAIFLNDGNGLKRRHKM